MLTPRRVDIETDRNILFEFHCRGNYESETPWAKSIPFERYREKWLSTSQPVSFLSALAESMKDEKTIAEIWEDKGQIIPYVWVTFTDIPDYNLTIAEVKDIVVAPDFQRRGIGLKVMEHVEQLARERGAQVLRSETGIDNVASQRLHEKSGFQTYGMLYEKVLDDEAV